MMGLNILPSSNGAPHSQSVLPAGSSSCSHAASGNDSAQNKRRGQVVMARGGGRSSAANSEVPLLQQQGEGELSEMLEHFLLSFEQHIDREEVETGGEREAPVRSSQESEQQNVETETPVGCSQSPEASARGAGPPRHTKKTRGKVIEPEKQRKKRRKNEYKLSLEKRRVRVRNPPPSSVTKAKVVHDGGDKQLKQRPVVKLERSGLMVRLQGDSRQSLEVKVNNISTLPAND